MNSNIPKSKTIIITTAYKYKSIDVCKTDFKIENNIDSSKGKKPGILVRYPFYKTY